MRQSGGGTGYGGATSLGFAWPYGRDDAKSAKEGIVLDTR